MKIAIIGAGISGLLSALELVEQGCSVIIFDQQQAGKAGGREVGERRGDVQGTERAHPPLRADPARPYESGCVRQVRDHPHSTIGEQPHGDRPGGWA